MRKLAWAIAFLLAIASWGSAAIILEAAPEQLVEGHTVFLTIGVVENKTEAERYAAAVAVLVRDRTQKINEWRFPGVLWFNDQYLVDPEQQEKKSRVNDRYPCTGAVIALNRGDPMDADALGRWSLVNATYLNESYLITDPNEHQWIVDLWNTTNGSHAWSVAIMNNHWQAHIPDDGKRNCRTYTDTLNVRYGSAVNQTFATPDFLDPRHKDPGDHGIGYPCDDCSPIQYNAVLYFRLDHLRMQNASKDHREGVGDDWWADAAACHDSVTNDWICPNEADDQEGNSHPYNPDLPWPGVSYDGRNNHGGSDVCQPDGNIVDCHATFDIDIYFGYLRPPVVRTYWLVDTPGADAPYHCHWDNEPCDSSALPIPP